MAEEYDELVSNMSTVEDALVKYVAEESLDESFLGEAAVGTVENVLLDESDSFVRFELRLPNGRLGSVSFSEYDMSRGCVELFLESANSSVSDIESVYLAEVPVTYTEQNGWVVFYGDSVLLESVYEAGSSLFWGIGRRSGFPSAKWPVNGLIVSPVVGGLLWSVVSGSVGVVFLGLCVFVFGLFFRAVLSGMFRPRMERVSVE